MIAHLNAIKAALEAHGWTSYLLDATGATSWPYVVISPGYAGDPERPLADVTAVIHGDIRVTVAGLSPASTVGLAQAVRDELSPMLSWGNVGVPERVARLRWVRTELTEVDRDVTVPSTGTHPIFRVDTYRLVSEPNPTPTP